MSKRLEFDSIEKSFDEHSLLSSIHVACDFGNIIGLLGRNGSGKSTLMKIVFGTSAATHKSVRVNGRPLLGNYLKQGLIGYLPQKEFIPRHLKVIEVLSYYEVELTALLDPFPDFAKWLHEPVTRLSGGYLRILEVLLILKSKHEFVMLDEPFSGLMPLHIDILKQVILNEKIKKGIIISDHLFRHIIEISDKTYLLTHGKTYLIKNADELISRGYLLS